MITMYTLKGIFPEPKKEQKKNFIRENMKQLKFIAGSTKASKEPKFAVRLPPRDTGAAVGTVRSSQSGKLAVNKTSSTNSRKKNNDLRIKKGDMAEFLKRKEQLHGKGTDHDDYDAQSSESSGRLRDIGCQTVESNLAQQLEDSTKLTMLYPKKEDTGKASGDSSRRAAVTPPESPMGRDSDRPRSKLNAILERKQPKNEDPYLPAGYQKGVLPKYLRERKEPGAGAGGGAEAADEGGEGACPAGHVTLPDNERKETLRMLRNSFAELVSELNKMPVRTDTLRMRNRKCDLERQLAKLEDGIKVFSRPKVYVKVGE